MYTDELMVADASLIAMRDEMPPLPRRASRRLHGARMHAAARHDFRFAAAIRLRISIISASSFAMLHGCKIFALFASLRRLGDIILFRERRVAAHPTASPISAQDSAYFHFREYARRSTPTTATLFIFSIYHIAWRSILSTRRLLLAQTMPLIEAFLAIRPPRECLLQAGWGRRLFIELYFIHVDYIAVDYLLAWWTRWWRGCVLAILFRRGFIRPRPGRASAAVSIATPRGLLYISLSAPGLTLGLVARILARRRLHTLLRPALLRHCIYLAIFTTYSCMLFLWRAVREYISSD